MDSKTGARERARERARAGERDHGAILHTERARTRLFFFPLWLALKRLVHAWHLGAWSYDSSTGSTRASTRALHNKQDKGIMWP